MKNVCFSILKSMKARCLSAIDGPWTNLGCEEVPSSIICFIQLNGLSFNWIWWMSSQGRIYSFSNELPVQAERSKTTNYWSNNKLHKRVTIIFQMHLKTKWSLLNEETTKREALSQMKQQQIQEVRHYKAWPIPTAAIMLIFPQRINHTRWAILWQQLNDRNVCKHEARFKKRFTTEPSPIPTSAIMAILPMH